MNGRLPDMKGLTRMLSFGKRRPPPPDLVIDNRLTFIDNKAHQHERIQPETARQLAGNLGAVISGAGCLTGNLAQAAADVQQRLADGSLSESDAATLVDRLHNAHQDIERACSMVSRIRASIAPPAASHDAEHHKGD